VESRAEEILSLAQELLEAKTRVRELEERFAMLVDGQAPRVLGSTETGLAEKLRILFRSRPRQQLTLADVVKTFPDEPAASLRTTTARIARARDGIEKVPNTRGLYRYCAPKVVRLRELFADAYSDSDVTNENDVENENDLEEIPELINSP
jgi:hypothetical protein